MDHGLHQNAPNGLNTPARNCSNAHYKWSGDLCVSFTVWVCVWTCFYNKSSVKMDFVGMTQTSKYACSMEVVISRFLKLFLAKSNYNHGAWLAHAIRKNPPKQHQLHSCLSYLYHRVMINEPLKGAGDILSTDETQIDTWSNGSKRPLRIY